MRCGNYRWGREAPHEHANADEVRACYAKAGRISEPEDRFNGSEGLVKISDGPTWPPSEAQVSYVIGLQGERALPAEYDVKDADQLRGMEKDEVSRLIGELKALPYKDPKGGGQPSYDIPAGRYALHGPDGWWFYQVETPTDGRWKGYTFIKRLIGAPGSYKKIDMSAAVRHSTLKIIQADIEKAMVDYGMQSGVCGRCASPLSDPQSLARGIGPVCYGKLGW